MTVNRRDGRSPFHEAWECLGTARREFTSVSSLNQAATYAVVNGCENAVRALYEMATGVEFPYQGFKAEEHKPASLVRAVGAFEFYSPGTQRFLAKYEGANLADVRYDKTQAYRDHVKPKGASRGQELVDGAEQFVRETEALAARPEVLDAVRAKRRN